QQGIRADLVTGVQTCALPIYLELRRLQPFPEIGPGRLLQIGRVHGLDPGGIERDEVVLVVVGREALHERLVGDVVLAPGAFAARSEERRVGKGCRSSGAWEGG